VRRAGASCKAIIAITGPQTGDDGLKHSNITCLDGFDGAMTLRDGTWSLDFKEPSVSPTEPPATGAKPTAIDLHCTPPPMFSGNAKDAVVASYVSVHGPYWMVKHVFAGGSTVDRAMQYGLHDASTLNVIA
jgi:hypothetical protein